jgi:hypothetical protein
LARKPAFDKLAIRAVSVFLAGRLVFCRTRSAFLEHESAKAELKGLMPEDAKEAIGHGIRARRSKSGAVSFDVTEPGGGRTHPARTTDQAFLSELTKAQAACAALFSRRQFQGSSSAISV